MRLGVIGCGTIASAVVHRTAQNGHRIAVSRRSARHAHALFGACDSVRIGENQDVVDASDVFYLGLLAEQARDVLGNLEFRDDERIITFMAGATLEEADALVRPARAVAICKAMDTPGGYNRRLRLHIEASRISDMLRSDLSALE